VKVLANGLTLIVCERPEAPVFSFYTLVDVGSADDPEGASGLAHMFEHIAFKGTTQIGTTNYPAEKVALAKVEIAYAAYDAEYRKRVGQDAAKLAALKKVFEDAQAAAQKFVVPNQFAELAEENGAVGLNASTEEDSTQYFWSMPENRLELWAYMESGRIRASGGARVLQGARRGAGGAADAHRLQPHRRNGGAVSGCGVHGAFLSRAHCGMGERDQPGERDRGGGVPREVLCAGEHCGGVVGDMKAADAIPLLTKYFGAIPAGPKPEPMTTVEPPQFAEKSVTIREAAQPFYLEGYHKPDLSRPRRLGVRRDHGHFSNGRTARLYKALVRDQKIAADAEGFSGFPGEKFPGLFAFYGVPVPGHTPDEMRDAIHKEIERLKTTDVTDEELAMFKTRARASLLRGLADNQGLATQLAEYQTRYGDWRELFRQLDRVDKVSKADVRRVANKIFVESNRTSIRIEFTLPAPAQSETQSAGGAK